MTYPKLGNPAIERFVPAYPMPSHKKGRTCPPSSAAPTSRSRRRARTRAWPVTGSRVHDTASQRAIARPGNIANTTKLAGIHTRTPKIAPFAQAAKYSWFIPDDAELAEGREHARASEHAGQDLHGPHSREERHGGQGDHEHPQLLRVSRSRPGAPARRHEQRFPARLTAARHFSTAAASGERGCPYLLLLPAPP